MHGLSRLGTGSNRSVSPSPPSSPRFRHGRYKNFSGAGGSAGGGRGGKQSAADKIVFVLISAVFRRKGVLLFAPLVYISGMLLFMGTLGFDVVSLKNAVVVVHRRSPPGSVYRSPQVFQKLWPFMEAESNASYNALMTAWNLKMHQGWKPCASSIISRTGFSELPKSNGFLIIEANGGLNQQRLSICDAVAVAWLLNATLLIPIFHLNSVWRDSSKFGDIFDEEFFVHALKNHVNVVRELPEDVLQRFDNNISNIVNLRVKGWSSPAHYLQKVLPKLEAMGAVRIAPFSNRLAYSVSSNVQGLRCLSNFEALRFSEPIRMLAGKMVERMVKNSSHSGGKYVSVHLRFEMDMVAFSCCEYDGGEEERHEMDIARERSWRGKFRRRGRVIRPGVNRMDGKCPLTPLEVGMMLRGMGFDNNTSVFVAAGNIYKAEKYMAPLKQMFPRLETKDTLATPEELAPFKGHLSRLAALDYTVCLHSEVFVTTQGGNFPHFLMGHRRYLYGGHAKTIKPDKRKLALLFDNPHIRWETFKRQMRDMLHHSDVKGGEVKKASGSVYTFPMPDCMCKQTEEEEEEEEEERNENSNTTKLSY
ncbi:O-fucosyltransferase family protein isoform 1 [Theobroma cacao]|uniref:O-fucosyltransferase family protein n=1 Tax=Theobroma cacao TaxID=3641 RepID=A0A061FIW9_THECC|nr:O-fucosyltransferase family protein isoform 1 [Theobroma cacao]